MVKEIHSSFSWEHRDRNESCKEQKLKQYFSSICVNFAEECLRCHNHYRVQHGCAPLHLSSQISQFSQEWANVMAENDHLCHSHHQKYGENLFSKYFSDNSLPTVTGKEVVDSWYSEHLLFSFEGHATRETLFQTGHFTQLIWNSSKELGVGIAVSKNNRIFAVANYFPPGNILKKLRDNVPQRMHSTYVLRKHSKQFYRKEFNAYRHNLHYCGIYNSLPYSFTKLS